LYITPHDLRRTFGTVANNSSISYPVLKRLLNHREAKSTDDVTLQYIQVSQRQLRDASNSIESFYCRLAGMTQDEIISKYY
jgi:integrase